MGRPCALLAIVLAACTPIRPLDAPSDAGGRDGGARDAAAEDAGPEVDAGSDAGCEASDPCNGVDDDCDPSTPDGADDPMLGMPCDGADGDACIEGTYDGCAAGALTCSDATADTPETCDLLGADEDCDGMTNEPGAVGSRMAWPDVDGDGFGDDAMGPMMLCAAGSPVRLVDRGGDCDDADRDVRPGRAEQCNTRDDDCNGMRDEGTSCPNGCTGAEHGGHVYQFCENNLAWGASATACSSMGYDLVTIDDVSENDWVTAEAIARGTGGGATGGAWIGIRFVDGAPVWDDGSAVGYTNWQTGQPDIMGCGRIQPLMSGLWADFPCTPFVAADFICEAP